MDHSSRSNPLLPRPTRFGSVQPSLVQPGKMAQARPRAALADVSNRNGHHVQADKTRKAQAQPQAQAAPVAAARAMPPPVTTALPMRRIPSAPAAGAHDEIDHGARPTYSFSQMALQPSINLAGDANDVSMTTDAGERTVENSLSGKVVRDDSNISDTIASEGSETFDDLELDVDPASLVTLPLEQEYAAQRRVDEICDRYYETVVHPQSEAAHVERQKLVANHQLDPSVAALDDEMYMLGLDPEEARDTSMVAEYANDIFDYMSRCERDSMANPNYMDFQDEIQWHMRATLIDWLMQVHMRYHMLPETLWIAVNIVDRFLSARIVSLAKLQLVGVTAMFIASKYEEILAPSVEEFVFMTENGYSREEILKGERIVLSTLEFNVSTYCTPYLWVRRISKADDYDIQTRTLCKFLMEVTLLNHLFLRARPSPIAAVGMYLSKRMLGGIWDDAFVYYSRFTEEQLIPGANLVLEKLIEPGFEEQFVFQKYASKKFLKASIFSRNWALRNHSVMVAAHAASSFAAAAYA